MKEIDYNLLAKCIAGEASSKEKEALNHWIDESGDNKKLYEQYVHFYYQSSIIESIDTTSLRRYQKSKKPNWKYMIAVAASIAFVITLVYLFSQWHYANEQMPVVAENTIITKSNPGGQKSTIILPDGSKVWLNADSELRYYENFTDSIRQVKLVGEAYFNVVQDPSKPFIVEVNNLKTIVLGTSFNVTAFPETKNTTVSLQSGKLKLTTVEEEIYLEPGEKARHTPQNGTLGKQKVDIDKIALWKDGILVFEREKFSQIIHQLERWYGVQIVIQGQPSSRWRFTGYFENENLKNVLEVLSFGKNIDFELEGKNVKLTMN